MATKSNHKYRVNVYLGKELYERFEQEAKAMGISVATFTKILLNTGYEFAKGIEKGGVTYGNK